MNFLAQLSDGWDTPELFRTPRQNSEMFMDTVIVMLPLIFAFAAFMLYVQSDLSKYGHTKTKWAYRAAAFVCGVISICGFKNILFG